MDYYFSSDLGRAISANMMAFAETVRYLSKGGGLPDIVEDGGNAHDIANMADCISDMICDASHEEGGKVSLDTGEYLMMLSAVRQALDFYVSDFDSVEKAISEASQTEMDSPTVEQRLNTIRKTTFLIEYLEVSAPPEVFSDWMGFKKKILKTAIEDESSAFCDNNDE